MSLFLKEIDRTEYEEFLKEHQTFSFLQLPAWAEVKSGWQSKLLGWFDNQKLVIAGLVLIRYIPKTKWSLYYLPEGPVLSPDYAKNVIDWLTPLKDFAKKNNAFNLKLGPQVNVKTWYAKTVKNAITDNIYTKFRDIQADRINNYGIEIATKLKNLGGIQIETNDEGFGDVQPRYVFALEVGGKSDEELLSSFSQEWRRNIKKAENEKLIEQKKDETEVD